MNQHELEDRLKEFPLGSIRYFESIGSTNDEAASWIKADCPDLSLVVADEQTGGRGRGGRKWFTPPGSALAFSLVLRAETQIRLLLEHQNTARLNGLGALAVCRALQTKFGLPAQIKWPNDVLLDTKKVAGVLAEAHWLGSELTAVVLGIGINVSPDAVPAPNWDTLNPRPFSATCVQSALGQPVDRWALLAAILTELFHWYKLLAEKEFLLAWQEQLAFRDQWVQIIPPGMVASSEIGKILALGEDGSLRLQTESGAIVDLRAGEIHAAPPPLDRFRLRPVDSLRN